MECLVTLMCIFLLFLWAYEDLQEAKKNKPK
jgi:hypothetical protein